MKYSREFCLSRHFLNMRHCGPAINYRDLATIGWLRTGFSESSDIPRAHLLAVCDRVLRVRKEVAPPLSEISEREAHGIVFRWLRELEKESEEWWHNDGINIPPERLADTLDDLRSDEVCYSGGNEREEAADGSSDLNYFLKREGIECPKDSRAYQKLRSLFRRARVENLQRSIDRVTHNPVRAREALFRNVFAHSEFEERTVITLGELLRRFDAMLVENKRADVTRRTYQIPMRVLREVLGESTRLSSITKEKIAILSQYLSVVTITTSIISIPEICDPIIRPLNI